MYVVSFEGDIAIIAATQFSIPFLYDMSITLNVINLVEAKFQLSKQAFKVESAVDTEAN